jgi:hypothetical protein
MDALGARSPNSDNPKLTDKELRKLERYLAVNLAGVLGEMDRREMLCTVVLYSASQDVLDAIHEEEEAQWRQEQAEARRPGDLKSERSA